MKLYSITPENELKPDALIDQSACQQRGNNINTQISLSRASQTLKFCEDNGIALRGHTFVWYSQTPDWFFRENFNSSGTYVSYYLDSKTLYFLCCLVLQGFRLCGVDRAFRSPWTFGKISPPYKYS